jgi:type VI secretion system protein ImpA
MPLSEELLTPIPGANPAGENLRYAPVYDKIKEARRQDDDVPQGEWRRERKLADWPTTIKLITEALSKKSKDLQLAAWLTEALLRREGIGGLKNGLETIRALLENFWENLYPEIEDGDAEMRATPLQWIGDKLEAPLKDAPLTRNGLSWYRYKESRAIGYEADAVENEAKAAARQEAIAEGKSTAEDFDAAFDATPKAFYAQSLETCDAILSELELLTELCDGKFGDVAPSFGRLRSAVEEVRQTVYILLQKKREREPDAPTEAPEAEFEEAPSEPEAEATWTTAAAAAPAPARAPVRKAPSGEPASREDAVESAIAAARFIRREEPYSPVPYLMLRGLRWGELRANGASIDPNLLEAPPGEIRQQLKRLAMEANWTDVLETAETAMAMPCGRGWLDLQRYAGRACYELGSWYDPIALAVKSSVRSLLHDFPDLPQMTLMDDTPCANAETVAWLKELAPAEGTAPAPVFVPEASSEAGPDAAPDVGELALQAAAAGRPQEGIELLSREISRERSGRARFQRKVQLAQLCLSIGREAIAYPILNDLAQEIEQRRLDEWEAPDAVAHPLALLFRCLDKLQGNPEEKQRLYHRICRLDPVQAMSCSV